MRTDDVGGGHVCAMPVGAWSDGQPARCSDSGVEVRELESRLVGRPEYDECDAQDEQCCDGIDEHHDTRCEYWAFCVQLLGRCWADCE